MSEIGQSFTGPGRTAVLLEGAWCEAGCADCRLINSRGLDVEFRNRGWHLVVSARGQRNGEARTSFLGRTGIALSEMNPSGMVEEISWRTAAPLGGTLPEPGAASVLVDESIASHLMAQLGGTLVASDETVAGLAQRRRVGPEGLSIVDVADPSREAAWDGEGVPRQTLALVEDGRLVSLLTDLTLAKRHGLPPTGSARRRSFRDYPAAGPSRLIVRFPRAERGTEELIRALAPGLLLTTARFIPSEYGPGGMLLGGGIWTSEGRAARAIRGAIVRGGPMELLGALSAASAPRGLGWSHEADCGSILVAAEILPA